MKGLILAGGHGTRLYPTTKLYNKHLILVYDKPMIFYPIMTMRDSGITDIILSVTDEDWLEQFRRLLGTGSELGVNLTYVIQGEPKGIAHGIYSARKFLESNSGKFLVLLGDNYFSEPLQFWVEYFEKLSLDAFVFGRQVERPENYGVMEFGEHTELRRVIEKPKEPPSRIAMLGAYFLSQKFFDIFEQLKPSPRGEYEITDAINALMPNVGWAPYANVWLDLGTPSDILACANFLALRTSPKVQSVWLEWWKQNAPKELWVCPACRFSYAGPSECEAGHERVTAIRFVRE